MMSTISDLYSRYTSSLSNVPAYQPKAYSPPAGTGDISEILDQLIARYKVGGEFGKEAETLQSIKKRKTLGSQKQALVSSGLSGSTVGAGLESKYEQEVGVPFGLGLEEERMKGLTGAATAKAGFMEREADRQMSFQSEQERIKMMYEELALKAAQQQGQMSFSTGVAYQPELASNQMAYSGGSSASVGGGGAHAAGGMDISPGPAPYGQPTGGGGATGAGWGQPAGSAPTPSGAPAPSSSGGGAGFERGWVEHAHITGRNAQGKPIYAPDPGYTLNLGEVEAAGGWAPGMGPAAPKPSGKPGGDINTQAFRGFSY